MAVDWKNILSMWLQEEDFPKASDKLYDWLLLQNLTTVEFRNVFTEWFERYFNPHPYPPSNSYLEIISKYACQLAAFFPEDQQQYWEKYFCYAMLRLSKDNPTFAVNLPKNKIVDSRKTHKRIYQMLYESTLSPLLTIEEKGIPPSYYTYVISYKTIELCRIGMDYEVEDSLNVVFTWRTQTIPDDTERDYILVIVNEIICSLFSHMNGTVQGYTDIQEFPVPEQVELPDDEQKAKTAINQKGKQGPRRYSLEEKKMAFLEWQQLDRDKHPITLEEWLEERFGATGGKLNVPKSTFYGWKKYIES